MTALGIAALALLFAWLFGGFLFRLGGLLLVFAGAIGMAVSGDANGILVAATGAVLWLLGHGHYALRRQGYKSPLARYVFCCWAPKLQFSSKGGGRRHLSGASCVLKSDPTAQLESAARSPRRCDKS